MSTPIERVSALVVGTVESVSPDSIRVILELDAPQATALNTGAPSRFPRLNGYVLVPNETGAVVGLVTWLGIERSPFPKRTGLRDFGVIDLPFPLRQMTLTPVGTLIQTGDDDRSNRYDLSRGIAVYPSVGDPAMLPTTDQLNAIIEPSGKDLRVPIGTSPLTSQATIAIDPDKLFGRHVAVLGNTGSGKSCSVSGLIRWSLLAAENARVDEPAPLAAEEPEQTPEPGGESVNARFIVLDPNGEYIDTFADLGHRVFRVPPVESPHKDLSIPAWMWNSQEWSSISAAAPAAQRPVLLQGLRDMRAGEPMAEPQTARVTRCMRGYKRQLAQVLAQGPSYFSSTEFRETRACGDLLLNIVSDTTRYAEEADAPLKGLLEALVQRAGDVAAGRRWQGSGGPNHYGFNAFNETELREVSDTLDAVFEGLPEDSDAIPPSEDAPIAFPVNELADHLEHIAEDVAGGQAGQFIATLAMRIRMMLADRRLGPIVDSPTDVTLEDWLTDYIGANQASNGQLAVLDLSLVPADVLHVVISVIARIIFEALQRYRRLERKELPTVLVLEEAHTFIQRSGIRDDDGRVSPAQMCCQTFEKIAREGRKFGLGLMLSSQRPSELSPTVLAQCNTFLLHRIVNDRDQELVQKLVPDNLGGLLKGLPNLPTRQAILLGWATPVPALVEITELPLEHRPASADPAFWDTWVGRERREIDWNKVREDWTT